MELKLTFRHLESTPSIEDVINKKALKLKKYFDGKISIHWICSIENDIHVSEIVLNAGHTNFHAKSDGSDLYKVIDLVEHKMEKQVQKHHEKMKDKIHRH